MYFHISSQLWLYSQGRPHAQLVCILSVAFWSAFRTVCCDAPNGETLEEKGRHFVWSHSANCSKLPHLNLISPAPAEDVHTVHDAGVGPKTQRLCRRGVIRVRSERI